MSLKTTISYSQTSAILTIEGLPDLSLNQDEENIGILSSWKLSLIGTSELEGKLIHLKAMMSVVLPYARYCLSNVKREFGSSDSPVSISPTRDKHKLLLRSSQENVKPLELLIDDAELSDLVRCLDSLYLDSRVSIDWKVPINKPLDKVEQTSRSPFAEIVGLPIFGISITLLTSLMFLLIPVAQEDDSNYLLKSLIMIEHSKDS